MDETNCVGFGMKTERADGILSKPGLDTTATELSVIESVFRLGEGLGPSAINTTNKETMVESFY